MIANRISGNIISDAFTDGKLNVPIEFEWFETDKKRMRKVAEDGTHRDGGIPSSLGIGLAECISHRMAASSLLPSSLRVLFADMSFTLSSSPPPADDRSEDGDRPEADDVEREIDVGEVR